MRPGPRTRLALLATAVGAVFAAIVLTGGVSAGEVRDAVNGYGPAAPLVFVAAMAVLGAALVPIPLLAGASGLLFGTLAGTPLSICGALLAATLAFSISRRLGAPAVEEVAGDRLRGWQLWIERRGFLAVLYARLAPAMPYNVISYAAGLTRVRYLPFIGATALGISPRAFAYTALGGSLGDLGSPTAIAAVAVLVAMGLTGLLVAWRGRSRERAAARPAGRAAEPAAGPRAS